MLSTELFLKKVNLIRFQKTIPSLKKSTQCQSCSKKKNSFLEAVYYLRCIFKSFGLLGNSYFNQKKSSRSHVVILKTYYGLDQGSVEKNFS